MSERQSWWNFIIILAAGVPVGATKAAGSDLVGLARLLCSHTELRQI